MYGIKASGNKKNLILPVIITSLIFTLLFSIAISKINYSSYANEIGILGNEDENSQQVAQVDTETQIQQQQEQQQPAEASLTEYEEAILYLINTARVSNGLCALQPNQALTDISRTRSTDMLGRNYFSHYTPEGTTIFNIMRQCGISWSVAGENLAHSLPADIGSPEAFMDAWMKSPGHAANILKNRYGMIGVGMTDNGDRRVVTTIFKNS